MGKIRYVSPEFVEFTLTYVAMLASSSRKLGPPTGCSWLSCAQATHDIPENAPANMPSRSLVLFSTHIAKTAINVSAENYTKNLPFILNPALFGLRVNSLLYPCHIAFQ